MAKIAYTIVIERGARNMSAYVPDLPGCIVTGRTEKEVMKLMAEAIRFHIEGLVADGLEVPAPRSIGRTVETELAVA